MKKDPNSHRSKIWMKRNDFTTNQHCRALLVKLFDIFHIEEIKITELQYLVFVLLYMLAMTILFYSMSVLACMISGQFISAGAFFAVINFLEIGIEYILQNLMNDICFGITNVISISGCNDIPFVNP